MLLHEVRVVRELAVEVIIGGERFRPRECTLSYLRTGSDRFQLGQPSSQR